MRKTSLVLILVSLALLTSSCFYNTHQIELKETPESLSEIEFDLVKNKELTVLPRVELLAGVLTQTSWMDRRGPKGEGNEYYQSLKTFFDDYKDHEAVKLAQKLTNKGFTYDAPIGFILTLEPLPTLENKVGFSDYLVERAFGEVILEDFRRALINLASESNFEAFYNSHTTTYEKIIAEQASQFDFTPSKEWMHAFYGDEQLAYTIVYAPAMFPGGGYAYYKEVEPGKYEAFEVVRERGESKTTPEFGEDILFLAIHEFGHTFVNPTFAEHSGLIETYDLIDLFKPVKSKMKDNAYGDLSTFYNEQVIRAITYLAIEELEGTDLAEKVKARDLQKGFYLTDFTIAQLRDYQRNRATYKTFKDFAPVLLERYYENKPELLEQAQVTF